MAQDGLKNVPLVTMVSTSPMNGFPDLENPPVASDGEESGEEKGIGYVARNTHGTFFGQTPKNKTTMKSQNNHPQDVIVSGIHLELTPALKTYVREKVDRLLRHEERIVRLRVELEHDSKQATTNRFAAKGHINLRGPDLNAVVTSHDCHKAIDLLVDKLDRMLRRRSRLLKVKRNHPHAVELDGVELPKVAAAAS